MKNLILVITIMFFACIYANGQVNISISQPQSGIRVPQLGNTIRVSLNGGVPAGRHLVVFIQDPTGQWWPYTNLSRIAGTNNWQVTSVQYGSTDDSNQQFNIQAIIIDQSAISNGLPIRGKTQYISNNLPIIMPDYIAIRDLYPNNLSAIVTIIRQ